ncbi:tetratricopeptide repeat protein [Duganella sp. CT11-25]|uniref:tetratricopeptide repeat protein n=1 Tax=unclassified Duganella TaxID=2636909 RepID=UPI0039B01F92
MSLINKMLQDLDARGGGSDAALEQQELKAVPSAERDRRPLMLAGAGAALIALAAGGWYGWQYWQGRSAPPAPVPKVIDNRIPDRPRLQEPPAAAADLSASSPAPAATKAEPESVAVAAPAKQGHRVPAAEHAEPAPVLPRKPASTAAAAPAASASGAVTELTPKQVAENTYRRALSSLQEGRVSTAMADLDRAVEIDPRNDAARQTYISLLLENKRTDDAIRQLRLALGIDPRQPGLAMVLARLQLEKGGPALQTLMNTLPYAGNSADYRGFVAGVLQREQRHAEAAQHYREALKLSPQSGVWWMGLGISLQAEQHLPEAREAYARARAASGLTPELQAFVDRKLEQLSR